MPLTARLRRQTGDLPVQPDRVSVARPGARARRPPDPVCPPAQHRPDHHGRAAGERAAPPAGNAALRHHLRPAVLREDPLQRWVAGDGGGRVTSRHRWRHSQPVRRWRTFEECSFMCLWESSAHSAGKERGINAVDKSILGRTLMIPQGRSQNFAQEGTKIIFGYQNATRDSLSSNFPCRSQNRRIHMYYVHTMHKRQPVKLPPNVSL